MLSLLPYIENIWSGTTTWQQESKDEAAAFLTAVDMNEVEAHSKTVHVQEVSELYKEGEVLFGLIATRW